MSAQYEVRGRAAVIALDFPPVNGIGSALRKELHGLFSRAIADEAVGAVEAFMRAYFLVAKDVGDLTRIFIAALEEQHKKPRPSLRRILPGFLRQRSPDDDFYVENGRLSANPAIFKSDPANLIRDLWDVRGLTIAENDNCDLVIDVTPDFGDKAINSATVADSLVVVHLSNKPTVAVAQAKSSYLRMWGEHHVQRLL